MKNSKKKQPQLSAEDRTRHRLGELSAARGLPDSVVGKQIAEERAKRGWSLDELADRSGVDRSNIWKLETGRYKTANVSTLIKLAGAFEFGYADLYRSRFPTSAELESITRRQMEWVIAQIARLPEKDQRVFLDFMVQILDGTFSEAARKKE